MKHMKTLNTAIVGSDYYSRYKVGHGQIDLSAMCKETPWAYAAPRITQHNTTTTTTTTTTRSSAFIAREKLGSDDSDFLTASDKLGSDIMKPDKRGSDRCGVEIVLRAQTFVLFCFVGRKFGTRGFLTRELYVTQRVRG